MFETAGQSQIHLIFALVGLPTHPSIPPPPAPANPPPPDASTAHLIRRHPPLISLLLHGIPRCCSPARWRSRPLPIEPAPFSSRSVASRAHHHKRLDRRRRSSGGDARRPGAAEPMSTRSTTSSVLNFLRHVSFPPDPRLLPSALKSCSALRLARALHAAAAVAGVSRDAFVASSLLHAYLRFGATADARSVLDGMPHRTVVGWSALIAAHASHGDAEGAWGLLERMRSDGVEPNVITWNGLVSGLNRSGRARDAVLALVRMHGEGFLPDATGVSCALSAVGDVGDVAVGEQLHGYVVKAGCRLDACVATALIDMYGKCGRADEIVRVFDESSHMDVASCNALVAGLSRNAQVSEALRLFREFVGRGIELNVVSWTSIVACCVQNGRDLEAVDLFREMQSEGIEPNSVTIPCVLPAFANIAALMHGRSAHCFSLRKGFHHDIYVGSALVDMYAKCGRVRDARMIFEAMPYRNVVSWNAMIGGYAMHGEAENAVRLFRSMQSSKEKPDLVTFTCVLGACSQAGWTEEGRRFSAHRASICGSASAHPSAPDSASAPRPLHCSADHRQVATLPMTLSCRQGSRRHRDSSPSMRDVTRFHLFVRRRRLRGPPQESRTAAVDRDEEGQAIIEIVARVGTPAEKGTGHSKLVRHYDSEASWNNLLPHDEAIFGYVIEARETKSSSHLLHKVKELVCFTFIAPIDMILICGRVRDARMIFEAMPSRNVVSWNAMIGGYAMHGDAENAVQLFRSMQSSEEKPDLVTFTCVLGACGQSGWTEEGRRYFNELSEPLRPERVSHMGKKQRKEC
uniref:Pentatricopeptide repeat-containing protein n=1 Tax=Oryza nivara TaxID=4536 RepID=A0A0E0HDI4_ORYNI